MEPSQNKQNQQKSTVWQAYALALRISVDLVVTITVPAVTAAWLGSWLDKRWGTYPWMFVLLLIVAFCLTAAVVYRKAKHYADQYNRQP